MQTLNIYVTDFGSSQLSYYLGSNLKRRIEEHGDISPFVFYENLHQPPTPPCFALMQIAEGWGQCGVGIATSLSSASKMTHFPALTRRFFYVWDLEWLRLRPRVYDIYSGFYLDENVELIARCEQHAELLVNSFNRVPAAIIPNFDVDSLLEFINKGDNNDKDTRQD